MPATPDDIALLRASPLFDGDWYRARYGDVALSGLSPEQHYLRIGAALGRDPGPDFSTRAYLADCRAALGMGALSRANPLVHFETEGRKAGIRPRPSQPARPDFGLTARRRVDIVLPVFNAATDTAACLQALADTDPGAGIDLRVIVVDDGSDPETAALLDRVCARPPGAALRFELLRHAENRGYTHAVNTGLAQGDAPVVITLNSDTIVTPGWVGGLLRCLRSDPRIGIVGPLSNAATWQSLPRLWDSPGTFAINRLPDGLDPARMAALLRQANPQPAYPRTPFVNGFCMAIRRGVIDQIGMLDADRFGAGYGEENDYCIRAAQAGFTLALADDIYIHHAKSKSFGAARRQTLSQAGHVALCDKHGADRVADLLGQVAALGETGPLAPLRLRLQRLLAQEPTIPPDSDTDSAQNWLLTQRILFLLPVGAGGGGAHSVIQEACAMRAIGVQARVAVGDFAYRDFLSVYRDIPEIETVLLPYNPDDLPRLAQGYDVLVATLYSTVAELTRIIRACPHILPAYYAQDYEPLFFTPGSAERTEAEASYTALPHLLVFAKTDWICNEIQTRHRVTVAKVSPSLDHSVYFPAALSAPVPGPASSPASSPAPSPAMRLCAMIRPGTTRRGAARTMAFLSKLKAQHGDAVAITLFGCEAQDPAMTWLDHDFAFENAGVITRPQVADLLRQTDLFVDLSDYQAFGRTGLEAMACGALALVPHLGGAHEYAIDGVNALVCDTQDQQACLNRVSELLHNPRQMQKMRRAALACASAYSARRAAMSILLVLAEGLARHRGPPPDQPVLPPVAPAPATGTRRGPVAAFAGADRLASGALALPGGPPPPTLPDLDIGVHLHLHYPDMLADMTRYLAHIPCPFRLYVSAAPDSAPDIRTYLARHLPGARLDLQSFANRGRDIGPWLAGFGAGMQRHQLICHIHSKASPHNAAKSDWRDQLLGAILGSPAGVAAIMQLFAETPHLGLVFPEYHPSLARQIGWGGNFPAAHALADRMGITLDPDALVPFPAGSMFWARPAALQPLFALGLGFEDFPKEAGQIDGTPAHAIERLLGEIVLASDHSLIQVQPRGDDAPA